MEENVKKLETDLYRYRSEIDGITNTYKKDKEDLQRQLDEREKLLEDKPNLSGQNSGMLIRRLLDDTKGSYEQVVASISDQERSSDDIEKLKIKV